MLQKSQLSMPKAVASHATLGVASDKTTPPARDPNLAVQEEYQIARRLNTVQSLELFIARHPDDALSRQERGPIYGLLAR